MTQIQIIALVIFVITYIGIIFTRLPWMNIDRPSAAFFGSVAMILFGVLSFDEAIAAIDFNTIALLLGMMIVITTLQLDGFFEFIARKTIKYAKTENSLLFHIILISGLGSAFMVNDVVVLLFTPIIISLCKKFKIAPIPYLIAEILSSNIGSAMTITGNPQNMLIGIHSGISYSSFLLHLLPISLMGLGMIYYVIKWMYKKEFNHPLQITENGTHSPYNFKSMVVSVPIFGVIVILFFFSNTLGMPIPLIALVGASIILLFGRIKPSTIIKDIDWVLLLFFASLFIVVKGIEHVGLMESIKSMALLSNDLQGIGMIHGFGLIFSQIVSNVPLVVAMLPMMHTAAQGDILWLALASASTLAGNATIIGAMANLIVIESAKKEGVHIKFMEFFKSGIIVTLLSFVISIGVLWLELKLMC